MYQPSPSSLTFKMITQKTCLLVLIVKVKV